MSQDLKLELTAHRYSPVFSAYPCLLACLRVVLNKDGVCGRKVKSPDGGLPLAWRPVKETHIFHLTGSQTQNVRDGITCKYNDSYASHMNVCQRDYFTVTTDKSADWAPIKMVKSRSLSNWSLFHGLKNKQLHVHLVRCWATSEDQFVLYNNQTMMIWKTGSIWIPFGQDSGPSRLYNILIFYYWI